MKARSQSGIALATTLIVLFLVVALVIGFSWMVLVDQRLGGVNGDQQFAFYGAEAGLEKMTGDLGVLFASDPTPTTAQVNAIASLAKTPQIQGIQYVNPDGSLGYDVSFPIDPNTGNPLAQNHSILSGPYQGLTGLITPFTLKVTAHNLVSGAEVRLERNVQTVAIPVFQFGMFSQTDLSYFPGPNFNFGGRVHTNGNLFLAAGGDTWFGDKLTAAGQVVREQLSNGWPVSSGYTGQVFIPTTSGGCSSQPTSSTGSCRALAASEGSVVAGPSSAANDPPWTSLSLGTYNGYVRSKTTGATPLKLSITLSSGNPIDVIRRGLPGEDVSDPATLAQRYYSEASIRILLSDNPADISNLPCEDTSVPPTPLAIASGLPLSSIAALGGVPLAESGAVNTTYTPGVSGSGDGYWTANGTPTLGAGLPSSGVATAGYIKIEIQTAYAVPPAACGTWKDVTAEVLSFGVAGRNLNPYNSANPNWNWVDAPNLPDPTTQIAQVPVSTCTDPNPNAIIRFERIRDNPSTDDVSTGQGGGTSGTSQACGFTGGVVTTNPSDYWPMVLFDTREGISRDYCPDNTSPCDEGPTLAGVMYYTELDVANLAKFLTGAIGTDGTSAKDPTNSSYNFVVYFSDRRGNYTPAPITAGTGFPQASPSGNETGEYGFEDDINPSSAWGCPNGTLDTGETLDEVENPAIQAVGGTPEDYGESVYPDRGLQGWLSGAGPGLSSASALNVNPNCSASPGYGPLWPRVLVNNTYEARENAPLFFRRALKIVDGSNINLGTCPDGVPCGLTITSENPVYVQGDFNASSGEGDFTGAHIATSVVADAVTLLSDNWNDANSFIVNTGNSASPYNTNWRAATTTTYRFAVVAGKGIAFPHPGSCGPSSCYQDFGTDGGVHNFLRFLENWGGQTLWYKGSIVSFYYNRQATGLYKCCSTVYSPPTRGYNFDSDFLNPSLLPPRTPLFRDVNAVGFTQTILPTP